MSASDHKQRLIARWLLLGVIMLVIQILLGGITRLTGSGLSITEWKPLMGALPPLNEKQWEQAFEKYQGIAQYKYLNTHFTLSDFKTIFFWEWLHREWARLVGLVFAIGFIYFLLRRYFNRKMVVPLLVLFLLGGLQAAIGWIMVQSGLNDTNLYVSHIRLAVHFVAAMALLCYTLWFALKLLVPEEGRLYQPGMNRMTLLVIGVLVLQLFYGAFMAGLKAGPAAPTWPMLNGTWIPEQVSRYGARTYSGMHQLISHPLAVQFIHRTLAYVLLLLISAWFYFATVASRRTPGALLGRGRWWTLALVLLQVLLGIVTVLHAARQNVSHFGAYEWLAEAHQLVAMFLLASLLINLYLVRRKRQPSAFI